MACGIAGQSAVRRFGWACGMTMTEAAIHICVCSSCLAGRNGLATQLAAALETAGLASQVSEVECMSGCARPSTISIRTTGKTAYLFGDITHEDVADILHFVALYGRSADGNFADARPLGALRFKALARIPGESRADGA